MEYTHVKIVCDDFECTFMYFVSQISPACAMLCWCKQLHRIKNARYEKVGEEITTDRSNFLFFTKEKRKESKTQFTRERKRRKKNKVETCEHGHQEKA